jgi:kinesin family member 26
VVAAGTDGCVFCYGHANTGKSHTMVGSDGRSIDMGVIPVAIAWLYRAVRERKTKTGARFSVRVSAMEITSKSEEPRDLLSAFASAEDNDRSPAYYLRGGSADWIHNQVPMSDKNFFPLSLPLKTNEQVY